MIEWKDCPDGPGWWWCRQGDDCRLWAMEVRAVGGVSSARLYTSGGPFDYTPWCDETAAGGWQWCRAIMPDDRDAADLAALRELERRTALNGGSEWGALDSAELAVAARLEHGGDVVTEWKCTVFGWRDDDPDCTGRSVLGESLSPILAEAVEAVLKARDS